MSEFYEQVTSGLGSVGHCQIKPEEAFCGGVTGNMWRTGRQPYKGEIRGSEGCCQAGEPFKIPNDPNNVGTNYSEQMPAKAPDRRNINKCKLWDGKREKGVAVG